MIGIHFANSRSFIIALFMALPLIASVSTALAAPEEEGKAIFGQKCAACHTIGQGRLVGPDLQSVTTKRDRDWLAASITAPDQLIARGDPIAKQLVQEYGMPMPNLGITAKEAEAIVAYFTSLAAPAAATPAKATQNAPAVSSAAIGDAAEGRALFLGESPLRAGGIPCISCHSVNSLGGLGGGTLAKDLTLSYNALAQAGLDAILANAPFPIMKAAYASYPLTDGETASLVAFLRQEVNSVRPTQTSSPYLFPVFAGIAVALLIALVHILWRGRLRGVRQALVQGGSR